MTVTFPRYLVSFHPKRLPHRFVDVLVIGGGIAGLRAAIAVDPQSSVLLVTKDKADQSNSNFAQGGIAGVLDPSDCFESHVADTIDAGGTLCDRQVVEMVIREAPERIRELSEWGARFDVEEGQLALGLEGGHSHHRVVHALGDATGKEVMRAMIDRARLEENVTIWENTFTLDLLTHDGVCRGALIWNRRYGMTILWAKQTVLCTGGVGQIYRETTNPEVATGDGHAIAFRAGAELVDMEFMQFHPTVLYMAGSSRSLITEAMRGAGARLVDQTGERFMTHYHQQAELAPRDVVTLAIVIQMEKTRHPSVYLDLSHLDSAWIYQRFPSIARVCAEFGIDIAHDRIPVRPGAHYMIGGVSVDHQGHTSLAGLWAAGEVTASGLHGANRLASNSLLEGLVYGKHAGQNASLAAANQPDTYQALAIENELLEPQGEPLDLKDIRNSLRSLTWRAAGVRRSADRLGDAANNIDRWCRYVLPREFMDPEGWELQNMLAISRVIIDAALRRQETRGVHVRTDFPETDQQRWQRRIGFSRTKPGRLMAAIR